MFYPVLTSTAGSTIPVEITEVSLVFALGHNQEFEVGRTYLTTLPAVGEGIFLLFDQEVRPDSLVLKFDVQQICHICLDQKGLLSLREEQGTGEERQVALRVSNQAILYVQPRDFKTSAFCNRVIEQQTYEEESRARAMVATHERAEAAVYL